MEDLKSLDTLDDIVFEKRNKSYGAYVLRKLYDRNILIALGAATFVFASVFFGIWARELFKDEPVAVKKAEKPKEFKVIDIALNNEIVKPSMAMKVDPPKIEKLQYIAYKPAPDEEVKEQPKSNQDLEKKNISTVSEKGKDTLVSEGGGEQVALTPDDLGVGPPVDEIYTGMLSQQANPTVNMNQFINSRLSDRTRHYISEREVKGRMFITITVGKDGKITEATLAKGLANCSPCNEEIPEILKQMPAWTPANANGYPVKVRFSVPVVIQ